jgi:serine kinase of HPr protein (carbohydrate metabolism regulator)
MSDTILLHGTCVAVGDCGVLLLGPPGAGKSDLALRLIDQEGAGTSGQRRKARLVADDQVAICRNGEILLASAPERLAGRLEVRGIGIVAVPVVESVALRLAVRLAAAASIERLPDVAMRHEILGLALQAVAIDAASPSAAARVRAAIDHLGLA